MNRFSPIRLGPTSSLFLVCFILLAGCGGILSSRHMTTTSTTIMHPSPANAYYFLPLVKIHLIAERKSASAQQTVSREQESSTATSETTEEGKTTKKSSSDTSDTREKAPAQMIAGRGCTLTLRETLTEPDSRYMFLLSHLTDIFADDKVTITMAANGLLAKVDTTSEGKAGEVVLKGAELATEIMKASIGLPAVKALAPTEMPFKYEVILDPTDAEAVTHFNTDLESQGCNLLVEVRAPEIASAATKQNDPPNAARDGIFYRPALPYIITFKTKDEKKAKESVRTVQTIYLPNAAPILALDIKRPSFVKSTQTIEFENGLLKSWSITKPSEALGFVSIPVGAVKSIAAIPSELFTFRVQTIQGEAGVLQAQQKLLDAQKDLLRMQEELRKAQEEALKRQTGQAQP